MDLEWESINGGDGLRKRRGEFKRAWWRAGGCNLRERGRRWRKEFEREKERTDGGEFEREKERTDGEKEGKKNKQFTGSMFAGAIIISFLLENNQGSTIPRFTGGCLIKET
ncbi:hypothetical protein LguiA_024040 [Lonicera macranthoides]